MALETMDSRELGLVLSQQLLGVEDMHYGLWEDDIELCLSNLPLAQQRYTNQLLDDIDELGIPTPRVLDIGCGTGQIMLQMLSRGYAADGLVPAPGFAKLVKEKLASIGADKARLFTVPFEKFEANEYRQYYDVALFSESFQYIPLDACFTQLETIVRPDGYVIICDFFKTEHDGDGLPGDGSFGGGHRWSDFNRRLQESSFSIVKSEDITPKMSPNLELVNTILMDKLSPAGETLGRYLSLNYPKSSKLLHFLLRKKLTRLKYKYFSGLRTRDTFERYKTYRHLVLQKQNLQ